MFGSVIEISTLSVLDVGKHLTLRHTVASQLVGDDHPRLVLQSPEQPLEEALGGFRIAPFLNEDVQRNTMLINGMVTVTGLAARTGPDEIGGMKLP